MVSPTSLVERVAASVAEALASERVRRRRAGHLTLGPDDERQLARAVAVRELEAHATEVLAGGDEPLGRAAELEVIDAALAAVLGLGRIQPLLDDPDITDIHVRGTSPVWVKHRDGHRSQLDPVVDTDDELVQLVRLVAARFGRSERRFDAAHPELNLQLPDGSRLFAAMEVSSHPTVVIRKHRFELSSLAELVRRDMLDRPVANLLAAAVRARRNLIIAGGTGTGKTTLLRALMNEVPRTERIITIEDSYELGIERFAELHPDHDALQARPPNIEGRGEVALAELARMALRMDPDRVIVGEVRGAEAFTMLMAMSQGNDGSMCTMHADSTASVFPKLAAYVSMANTGLPVETVNLLIANAVHLVVHLEQVEGTRRVTSVREVVDADRARIVSNEVVRRGPEGRAEPGYPLRQSTLVLLEQHGFDTDVFDDPVGWGAP